MDSSDKIDLAADMFWSFVGASLIGFGIAMLVFGKVTQDLFFIIVSGVTLISGALIYGLMTISVGITRLRIAIEKKDGD